MKITDFNHWESSL